MNSGRPVSDRLSQAMLLCACLLQIGMGTVLAVTNLPLCDEGFYGVPAQVLSASGALRNPVLESAGVGYLRGIDRTFYWMAPLSMVLQAGTFRVFGFGLIAQRGLSVVCGTGAVLLWFLTLRRLVKERVAALAAILLAADFLFLCVSSRGRSDAVSLFFAMGALAAYMQWRERNLALALAAANTACALSGIAHPNGGIAGIVCLAALALSLDRGRLRWRHLGIAAACYAILGVAWGLYIAKAPDLFVAQFFGNIAGRFSGPVTLTLLVQGEAARYASAYGLGFAGAKMVHYLLPISYLAAILWFAFTRKARGRAGVLLPMFAGVSLSLMFLEGLKQGWYLVHLCPLFAAFLAILLHDLWNGRGFLARLALLPSAAAVLFSVASLGYSAGNRNLQRLYEPAAAFLNARLGPRDLVFARSEFYFGLDCRTCLRDDERLGVLSGRRADYIVVDADYEQTWAKFRNASPQTYREIERRLSMEYREVFRNAGYRILGRKDPA